jgi:50S ribosomal protein L16 3-hydroxylase
MTNKIAGLLAPLGKAILSDKNQRICIGRYLTEPKSHVFFEPPERAKSRSNFGKLIRQNGAKLDLKTRLLYDKEHFYINGNDISVDKPDAKIFRHLADNRFLSAAEISNSDRPSLNASLHDLYLDGYLHAA